MTKPHRQPSRRQTSPSSARNRHPNSAAPSRRIVFVWAALIAGAILIVVAMIAGQPQSDQTANPNGDASSEADGPVFDLARRIPDDVTARGAVDAPVVIVEYADYRCPFCGVFDRDTLPKIVEEYIEDGLVRFEWRDLPVFGEQSIATAVAARAAGEQGLFWEYHTAVFAAAPERGHPEMHEEQFLAFARQVGVPDLDRFTADLASAELAARVRADHLEGTSIGISSTPIFLVNDTPIAGAQPLEAFRSVIDDELAKAEQRAQAK